MLVLAASAAGALIGTFTGLVPGVHVNTLAAMLLAAYPSIETAVSGIAPEGYAAVLVSCCIMSASAVHSFVDFVPSAFIGAPDPEDALTVLPAHRLLMEGRGMDAVRAAAIGSAVGAAAALALAIPMQWLLLQGLGPVLDTVTFGVLCVTLAVIVLTSRRPLVTMLLALVAGVLGYFVMNEDIPCTGILGEGTLLFPLLTGLFGIPPLLEIQKGARIPEQRDSGEDPVGPVPGLKGVLTGCLAGWFPGITATAGASLASAFSGEKDPARFISMTASIGTVTSVFSIVTLSVSGSGRSGTALAVKEIIGDSLDGFCSEAFILILFSIAIASALGYAITIQSGKVMAGVSSSVPAEILADAVLVLMVILVLLLTGPWGLIVLAISAGIGMLPPALGVSRVCLASCLIIPAMMSQMDIIRFGKP
jgi:putative membrane protein